MGGTQSWLSCDATYPDTDSRPNSDESENGDPILAVFMFLGTLVGVILLTIIVHCGIVACRSCRSRHRKRRHVARHQQHHGANASNAALAVDNASNQHQAIVITVAPPNVTDASANRVDADVESIVSSGSSSEDASLASSETSIDSTTARIAAQIASRRRSRFIDLHGSAMGLSSASISPMPAAGSSPQPSIAERQPGRLRPPTGIGYHGAGFDNPGLTDDRLF